MQLGVVLALLLLASPALAQAPTHPPLPEYVIPTGEVPPVAQTAVRAVMGERAKKGVPAAVMDAWNVRKDRAQAAEALRQPKK